MSTVKKVTIADYLFKGQQLSGELGVEVEVEGKGLPTGGFKFWNVTRDGSLRGEAYEYVFKDPVTRELTPKAISELYAVLNKCKIEDSGRAGVHVHVNIRDLDYQELFSFILLYVVFEEVLIDMCGEDRKGNLFCLRVDDAEYLLVKIRDLFMTMDFSQVNDRIRYSGINLTAIRKYGSLEFRSLPSPVSEELLNLWIQLLLKIKDKAKEFKDPRLIVTGVSEYGGRDFAASVFGELLESIPCTDWNRSVIRGMRKIQPLVPSINFELIQKFESRQRAIPEKKAKVIPDLANFVVNMNEAGMLRRQEAVRIMAGGVPRREAPIVFHPNAFVAGLRDNRGQHIDFEVFEARILNRGEN
jgi:hypothetical protein